MTMTATGRRPFIRSAIAATVGVQAAAMASNKASAALPFGLFGSTNDTISNEVALEKAVAFFQAFYTAFDSADAAAFLAFFAQTNQTTFQDATIGLNFTSYQALAGAFGQLLAAQKAVVGPGKLFKVAHITGDINYGAVVEHVNLKNTFFSTNGITDQTVFDLDGGLVVRNTDYSDSRELGITDIVGPANEAGVAFPVGAIHAGGTPRQIPPPVPPGSPALATGVTGKPSASPDMVKFVQDFQAALASGSAARILSFFTSDATYINPLIHQGDPGYGNFEQTIQIRGLNLIGKLFANVGNILPDTVSSKLVHVVGSLAGGGFEWKAGGAYANTGLDRTGLNGCTALDFFEGKIQRMSVKFDTFQMPQAYYDRIRSSLAANGVVDQ